MVKGTLLLEDTPVRGVCASQETVNIRGICEANDGTARRDTQAHGCTLYPVLGGVRSSLSD